MDTRRFRTDTPLSQETEGKTRMKRQSVLRGSVWLIGSALLAKILGAVFRLPLTAMLGGTGMGYFSCAYGLFLPVFALSVTGINTAVSALTAQALAKNDPQTADRTASLAMRMFGLGGILFSLLLFLTAEPFCTLLLHNPRAALSVRCFAPAVWFCCVNAVLRGICEGHSTMQPTAVSQVTEGIGRAVCGLGLCRFVCRHPAMLPQGMLLPEAAAAAAVLGVTLSTAIGTLTLLLFPPPRRSAPKLPPAHHRKDDRMLRQALLRTLLPVAAASLVTNLTTLIDLASAMRLLPQKADAANFLYGAYTGMAVTVFNLVPSVTNMFGKGVFPAFAESYARSCTAETGQLAETVIRRTVFFAVPAGLGMTALAAPLLTVLFPARPAETAAAAPALAVLGIAVIFSALCYPLFCMLQASGHADDTVRIMLAGAAVKLAGNLLLIPCLALRGIAASTLLCYAVILLLAVRRFRLRTGIRLRLLRLCGRSLFAGVLCAGTAYLLCPVLRCQLPLRIAPLAAAAAGAAVYFAGYLAVRGEGFSRSKIDLPEQT